MPELKKGKGKSMVSRVGFIWTRADITAMPQNFMKKLQCTWEVYNIKLGYLRYENMERAEIMLEVEGETQQWKVVVME